jgi:hypothetical protein
MQIIYFNNNSKPIISDASQISCFEIMHHFENMYRVSQEKSQMCGVKNSVCFLYIVAYRIIVFMYFCGLLEP